MLEVGFAIPLFYLVLITLVAGKPQYSIVVIETSSSSETFCETTCALDQNIFYYLKDIEYHFNSNVTFVQLAFN